MRNYYKYRVKKQKPSQCQLEFVRQIISGKKDGKRISVRLPKILNEFDTSAKTIIEALASHYSKQINPRSFWTKEQLQNELGDM